MEYYVYIMTNSHKNVLYTGVNNNLIKRVYEHRNHLDKGSFTDRYNIEYLIYFDVYRKQIYGAMRTSDFIQFEDMTEQVNVPEGHKHGTIFRAPQSLVNNLLNP